MANLAQVKYTLEHLEVIGGDNSSEHIDKAITELERAAAALNTITVQGRENLDSLLGCMLGIDMILGRDQKE